MNPITQKLRQTEEWALVHDSRKSDRILARFSNMIADKINDLIDENKRMEIRMNMLEEEINKLKLEK